MNEIVLHNTFQPVLCGCDILAASESFFHADRVTDFCVMIYVTDGVIFVTEDDIDYEVGKGELLFLKSGLRHFGRREIPKGTGWFFTHFMLDESDDCREFVADREPIEQYSPVRSLITLPKKLSGLSGTELEGEIMSFADYFRSDDPMKKWNINSRLFSLLTHIAFYEEREKKSESLSARLCGYLSEHYAEPFSAQKLEKEFFLSYKYLASVFRRDSGMTMLDFQTKVRMNEACRLLRSTLMPVGDIAEAVGYSDMLYFSRRFHGYIGMSPTDYRRQPPIY